MKRFVLIGLSSLLLSLSVPAIVDTNNDGISDLWERQYNGDQLFDPPIDPAADPDSDGWTNAQEAAAGTNPFDANPPSGFLRPDIINIPAVWEDVNGNPVLVTPNTIRVSWQTIPGKQYTLLYSPDLTASSWLPVEGAYIGNGTITEYNFPLIDPTSNFWRVTIEDVDTDGDGVSDAEEYVYGTNPNNAATIAGIPDLWLASIFPSVLQNGGLSTFDPNADADGDSLTNSEELAAGTNPNSVDTDGDGLNDDEDAVPNDAEINWPKTPETRYVWIPQVATTGAKALSKYGHILFPSNNGGSSNLSALHVLWDSNTSSWVNLT